MVAKIRGQVCIVLHKGNTGMDDELVIDLSPLRLPDTFTTLGEEIISFVDLPIESNNFDLDSPSVSDENEDENNNETDHEESDLIEDVENEDFETKTVEDLDAWEKRPIYQLNPYCISWKMERSEGKAVGKKLATVFKTTEPKASKSKKPNHVKPGKNRRSGGYGIG